MPSNHLILCRPLLLLPSIFPSIRVFSNESALCIQWPKYWSFNFYEFSSFCKSFCCFCVFLITASPFTLHYPGKTRPMDITQDTIPLNKTFTQNHIFCSQRPQAFLHRLSCVGARVLSHSVMSDSLQSHGLQHTRSPCPSPTPGACSNSYPSSQ